MRATRREAPRQQWGGFASYIARPSRFGAALVLGNTIGLILLVLGAMGLGAYRDALVANQLELLERQAVFARTLIEHDRVCGGKGCYENPDRARQVLLDASTGFNGRIALYRGINRQPALVAETQIADDLAPVALPIPDALPAQALPSDMSTAFASKLETWMFDVPLRDRAVDRTLDDELSALVLTDGSDVTSLRLTESDAITATVSLPITNKDTGAITGALVAETRNFEVASHRVRRALLPVVILTLATASISALILTAAVSQPIRELSAAADRIAASVGRAGRVRIPDFDHRPDEVGRLSRSFRAMTAALVERIENIDSFAADVSHEMKNPLTSLRSAVETLDKCKTDTQRERLLEVISNDVDRLDRLISDISSASRLDAQLATEERRVISAAQLISDVTSSYKAVTDAGGPMVNFWNDTDGDPKIFATPSAFGRVVRNLIDNAISFSPKNGAVTVALEKETGQRQGLVLLTVTDEGPGVPEENLESIFNRFYTSRPDGATFGSNSGLGLAIARQIVKSHGGYIWCENVKDDDNPDATGACFSVEIPIHKGGSA
ncbi:MAG: HAMP domain-containing sensor histidine kinase [Pseudomonadota bacterium]